LSGEPRIILGLDPGIASMGYGVLCANGDRLQSLTYGCLRTEATTPLPARLRSLFEHLVLLKGQYPVTDVAVESLFYSRNRSTAVAVGQARGVALLATVDERVVFGEYTPTAVKEAVAAYGAATKKDVQQMVRMILGLTVTPSPDDAADALAVAICHARQSHFAQLLSVQPSAISRRPSADG
jgi:crossover junction endodeoxyribonuclease RuvC